MPDNILPKHIKILGTPYSFSRISVLVTFTIQYNLIEKIYDLFDSISHVTLAYQMNLINLISFFGMVQGPSEAPQS